MRICRIIVRLDYTDYNFEHLDKPSLAVQSMRDVPEKFWDSISESFENRRIQASFQAKDGSSFIQMQFETRQTNFIYETADGFTLDEFEGHEILDRLFKITATVLKSQKIESFARAGLRVFYLGTCSGATLSDFSHRLIPSNTAEIVAEKFGPVRDMALIIEGDTPSKLAYRIAIGPYSTDESQKFFPQIHSKVSEKIADNFICDVDLAEQQFSLHVNPKKWAFPALKMANAFLTSFSADFVSNEGQNAH